MHGKPLLGVCGVSGCGGCDLAFLNIHDKLLEAESRWELAFAPLLLDRKVHHLRTLADGQVAVTLVSGCIRTEHDLEMATLVRGKSRVVVAFGACACAGGVPALANLLPSCLDPSVQSPLPAIPSSADQDPPPPPRVLSRVQPLHDVIKVDYRVPGCPPEPKRVWEVLCVLEGKGITPTGPVLGAGRSSVCDECKLVREGKVVSRLHRTTELVPDATRCLLEQGLVCMGPATRDGCGALCPTVSVPCTGCYGPPEGVLDQGAKMMAALGGLLDVAPLKSQPPIQVISMVDNALDAQPDWVGTLYKFGLAAALLGNVRGQGR